MKRCGRCKERFPKDCFHRNKFSKTGLHSYCKACYSEYIAERKKEKQHERRV